MLHTYSEALNWIHSRLRLGIKPGLKRMEWMLEKLGNPEQDMKVLHVGGTNGKGSTVTYLRSILNEAGYTVGTFTSPYIEQFNERISVNGVPVADVDITALANTIKPLADELEKTELGSPTEFEVITAMAIVYFAQKRLVHFAIFEVGLGGRFDSTNVVNPLLSLITNIGMDHTQILGNTIEEIAFEKAGIIKQDVPLFTTAKDETAIAVFKKEAKNKNSSVFRLEKDFIISEYEPKRKGEQFTLTYGQKTIESLETSLLGRHQTENAALAVAGLLFLQAHGHAIVTEENIRSGCKQAYWPGRMELISEHPVVLIDGAHNPEGLRAFSAAVKSRYSGKNIKLVFAALKDKDLTEMFTILGDLDVDVYFTQFDFPRAASAELLKAMSGIKSASYQSDWQVLLRRLADSLKEDEILAVTGSLYFISLVKPFLVNHFKQ